MKILIVEDDPFVGEDIREKIERLGYRATAVAESYDDALSAILVERPDLVLVDIELKGPLTGIDLSLELNKLELPFIYLTSLQDLTTYTLAKSTKPMRNLAKPIDLLNLRNAVEEAVSAFQPAADPEDSFFFAPDKNGRKIRIKQEEIVCLKAARTYCEVFFKDASHLLVSYPMGTVFQKITSKNIVQINRSCCINLEHIEWFRGNEVKMPNFKEPFPISPNFKETFNQRVVSL